MSSGSRSTDPPEPPRAPGFDAPHRAEQLAFFDIGPADTAALGGYHALAEGTVDRIVEDFYAHLLHFPELAQFLHAEPGRLERLKGLQRAYFLQLSEGRFDADYFESRLRVGHAHQELGIRPAWYIGAFALYLRLALRTLVAQRDEGAALLPTIEALVKAIFLDMSLAIHTYIFGGYVAREVAASLERAAEVAEGALRARAEVDRLKDDLMSMVVHDLKNPVNGISMMVQLALRKAQDLPETQRGYLLQIDRTCREMMRLIQNLLEISKMEEDKMPIARAPVVLADLADEVASEYTSVAEQAGRHLLVEVPTDLPAALADRTVLKRVLVNLVVNALRHTSSQEVRVEGAPGPAPAEVSLSVIDHGQGIPPAEQARIFEKFRSIRRSPADDPSADTGLGLPFCKLAVERMGGRIGLESLPGTRTVFTVTLPAAPA